MADKADRLPKAGEIIANKYLVEEVLGRGGMGLVVAATHQQLEQRVAIKFLTEEADKETKERFNREARAAAKLKSEHVARVHDVGELDDGTPYMVMEYLRGFDLGKISKRRGPLPISEAVAYVLQACEAIAEAHSVGIIHRDLKPPNLFLAENPDGTVTLKVLDFGISKDRTVESLSKTEEDLTKTSMVLGTPHFMAPEQMRSARDVDARADIWSLGAILYQLVTGKRPFRGPTFPELVVCVIQEDPPAPIGLRPELPEDLNRAILKCLAKHPDDRFGNVAELSFVIAPHGTPQSFGRAHRMARTLGLAPRSSAPGSAPPSSITDPGVSSRPPRYVSGMPMSSAPMSSPQPSSQSWYPDTEQEVGDPTREDPRDPSMGQPVSVDVLGLSALDRTEIAEELAGDGASSARDSTPSGAAPSTQMTAQTSIPPETVRRRKGPSVRALGMIAGASVTLLVAVAVLKPVSKSTPAVTPNDATGAVPSPSPTGDDPVADSAEAVADSPPDAGLPGGATPRPQTGVGVVPGPQPVEPSEPADPEPSEPVSSATAKVDPSALAPVPQPPTPQPPAPPPPKPPPPRPPPPKPPAPPKPPGNPLDMELK